MCKLRWPAVALLTLAGLTVIACALQRQLWPSMGYQDIAAWVQAVGSIIALCVAIAVPAWQQDKAEKLRQREAREHSWRTLRLAALLANQATDYAEAIRKVRSREQATEYLEERVMQREWIEEVQQALEAIPLTSIPTQEAIKSFMRVKRLVNYAAQEVHGDEPGRLPDRPQTKCGEWYGRPWIKFRDGLKQEATILNWQADQHTDEVLAVNEPASIFS